MSVELIDDLELEIQRLRKEQNAVILAHYYQQAEIQDLADFVGDSLAPDALRIAHDILGPKYRYVMSTVPSCIPLMRSISLPSDSLG